MNQFLYVSSHNEFQHFTVNHSVELKNLETGAHTNTIEGEFNYLLFSLGNVNIYSY